MKLKKTQEKVCTALKWAKISPARTSTKNPWNEKNIQETPWTIITILTIIITLNRQK